MTPEEDATRQLTRHRLRVRMFFFLPPLDLQPIPLPLLVRLLLQLDHLFREDPSTRCLGAELSCSLCWGSCMLFRYAASRFCELGARVQFAS